LALAEQIRRVTMEVLEIYESVNLIEPLSQRKFIEFLNSTLMEIATNSLKTVNDELMPVNNINNTINIDMLYKDCIVDNILFLTTRNGEYKAEFLRKLNNVSLTLWNKRAKGSKLKRKVW
jgi:hypothetical protein